MIGKRAYSQSKIKAGADGSKTGGHASRNRLLKNTYTSAAATDHKPSFNQDLAQAAPQQLESQYSDLKLQDADQHNFSIVPESSHKIDGNMIEYANFDIESKNVIGVSMRSSQLDDADHQRGGSRNKNNSELNHANNVGGPYAQNAKGEEYTVKNRNTQQQQHLSQRNFTMALDMSNEQGTSHQVL